MKILFKLLQENEPTKWPANNLPTTTGTSTMQPTGTTLFIPHCEDTPSQINVIEQTSQLNLQSQPIAIKNYSHQIAILSKLYINKIKYSSQKDNFDFKFEVF